jgi:hypothetical protein
LLRGWAHPSDRKYRLLGCALCRHFWDGMSDLARQSIEACERSCDELCSEAEREQAAALAFDAYINALAERAKRILDGAEDTTSVSIARAASILSEWSTYGASGATNEVMKVVAQHASQIPALSMTHDIFGNPFRTVSFDPAWRTSTAVALAKQMYESRDFGAMPILADALQDAGCDNDDILDHCRSEGTHVRGCWVVDLVLGQGVAVPDKAIPQPSRQLHVGHSPTYKTARPRVLGRRSGTREELKVG